ncbi:MAG: DUF192 domain-containing protein [Nitrosomonas sp.]|nr:DUF192 domain-containing protein [Nitrosomonas sp.]
MLTNPFFAALLLIGLWQNALADHQLPSTTDLTISGQVVSAEIAATPATLAAGLMHRQHLPENSGMLFIFPRAGLYAMWMKNTQIPLSVAFIDARGIIINIADMAPNTFKQHHSEKPASFALEMNQGWFAKYAITVGDQVHGLDNIRNGNKH